MIIEACHDLIPPEELKPVIEKIISNFVTEYCGNQQITVGLNTIREILTRMPLALDEEQIEHLIGFRTMKNQSVRAAAKSLVNFFRDVCPQLLPKKWRGRFTEINEDNDKEAIIYGQQALATKIEGQEYLNEGEDVAQ